MRLGVVVPARNEAAFIEETLRRTAAIEPDEIVVVDNASTDETAILVERLLPDVPNLRLLRNERDLGKGASVRRALGALTTEIAAIQDADAEYLPEELPPLAEIIRRGEADFVIGSRLLGGTPGVHAVYHYGGRLLNTAECLLFGLNLTDIASGHKVFRREPVLALNCIGRSFDWDFEVVARAARAGLRVVERPIRYRPRTLAQGKKVRPWHGLAALALLLRVRLGLA